MIVFISFSKGTICCRQKRPHHAENVSSYWHEIIGHLNPFMPSWLFYLTSLDRSILYVRGVWLVFIIVESFQLDANCVDPDQTPRLAASDLDLHRLPIMSLLWDARFKWVNSIRNVKKSTFEHASKLAFYVNLHRAVIGPSATLTARRRPDIDLRRMLTGDPRSLIRVFVVRTKNTMHLPLSEMRQVETLTRLCECVGWSESLQGAHVRRYVF